MTHHPAIPAGFKGTARLFPLPNLVLFPHLVQPLHVFEPRYRQLMADSLEDDRLMALALLRPGWEEDYHKSPPIYPAVCLGRIAQEERLPDGRYNLLLQGLARARVIEEIPTPKLYRTARVELLPDVPPGGQDQGKELARRLAGRVLDFFAGQPATQTQLRRLVEGGAPLGMLTDVFAFALPLGPEAKQLLLGEPDVARRVGLLLEGLAGLGKAPASPPARRFPPDFSAN
jgi:uncharacterized protein